MLDQEIYPKEQPLLQEEPVEKNQFQLRVLKLKLQGF